MRPPFALCSHRCAAALCRVVGVGLMLGVAACAPLPETGEAAVPSAQSATVAAPRLVPLDAALAAAGSGTLDEASGPALLARASALRARGAALRRAQVGG